ncbi:MAG: YidC/Oxa1 family membrane protein insertase [Bacilli bacterium]
MKKTLVILFSIFLLTGCTTYVKDGKTPVKNENTGQNLTQNILCKPTYESTIKQYTENGVNLDKLSECNDFKLSDGNYNDLWESLFVKPIALVILKINNLVGNAGISIILVGLFFKAILLPISMKSASQSERMKKAKPELETLEKKYSGKTDTDSMMKKNREMLLIHKKHGISMGVGCITGLIQMPILFAIIEAVNRIPTVFEGEFLGLSLGTTPYYGVTHGEYIYIILAIIIIFITYISFMFTSKDMPLEQQKQMKTMQNVMLLAITISAFFFPTATALYFMTSSAFSIVQNLLIKKVKLKNAK